MVQTRRRSPRASAAAPAAKIKADADDGGIDVDADADVGREETSAAAKGGRKRKASGGGNSGRGGKRGPKDTAGGAAAAKVATRASAKAKGAAPLDVTAPHYDLTKVKTAKACAQRWSDLFAIRDSRKRSLASSSAAGAGAESSDATRDGAHDVFDCSDLIVPSSHELINQEVERGIDRWKDLASRVVLDEDVGRDHFKRDVDDDERAALRNHERLLDATSGGDRRKQRLLPYNFDYACKKDPSTAEGGDNGDEGGVRKHRPRVISLMDPTQTIDYEEELWRVFRSVRTTEELERDHALGVAKKSGDAGGKDNDGADGNNGNGRAADATLGCRHTFAVRNNLKEWILQYSRLDAHSLGRLRVRERHANPFVGYGRATPASQSSSVATNPAPRGESSAGRSAPPSTTVRFEILRHCQQLKRGSGTDGNRMEVDLHGGHHTLLDLHRLLVECALNSDGRVKGSGDDDNVRPGVFFIENAFYTCGEAGDRVVESIKSWLEDKEAGVAPRKGEEEEDALEVSEATSTPRQHFLGISPNTKSIPMSEMKLEDLPLRLGVRYFHMFVPSPTPLNLRPNNLWSLANESAVYVTGIHTHDNAPGGNGGQTNAKPPIIIHDAWSPPQRHVCLACNFSLATVVTVDDPLTDAAPPVLEDAESSKVRLEGVPMCSSCYRALHYQQNDVQGGDGGGQPMLELRSSRSPGLVFPIEDYQRMVTASSLDQIPKGTAF